MSEGRMMERPAKREHIVILGAGFGGITAFLKLDRALRRRGLLGRYRIILVDRHAHHLYTPALYEIAAIPRGEAGAVTLKPSICIPLENILARTPGAELLGEEVVALDPTRRRVRFASGGELAFAYAVIALGAETNFFNIPGLAERAYPIKTFADAVRLRNRIEELMERGAETLRIVIGGGGPAGVELAAEFVNFLCVMKERLAAGTCREEITLVEASPEILSGFNRAVVRRARRRLKRLGVRVLTGTPITGVSPTTVFLKGGRKIPYHILVWAGGVRPTGALQNFGLTLDGRGGIKVNEFLEAAPRIYAIGDNASFLHPKSRMPLPGNVPVAESEARLAAKNIVADIIGEARSPFRPPERWPFILAVGGKYAVSDLVIVKFSGFLGWILKQLVELRYLLFILPFPKALRMWLRAVYYETRND
ncbi:MAG: hypothetical protein A3B37_02940 [Candidatus Sungbacteria bacterium RIFCSPLOWO2_01_FULL_59_16]|uniref:FAD/NAD(P)-binding domain-containing protein n=1 Tax=Candidatus Sungbacteria bacterium RIFCSPLOWO2_01_FULL_59_16 TaxID=1802280 RepID=A0A1G2LDQ2_9BACT|nr:MAG: hypothetical protein A3B37_02940 [Candidatus Sungbacteria bacterium RIFCSPLOWO2_01_FULL_59_16]